MERLLGSGNCHLFLAQDRAAGRLRNRSNVWVHDCSTLVKSNLTEYAGKNLRVALSSILRHAYNSITASIKAEDTFLVRSQVVFVQLKVTLELLLLVKRRSNCRVD